MQKNKKILGDYNEWLRVKSDRYENVLGAFEDDRLNENGKSMCGAEHHF